MIVGTDIVNGEVLCVNDGVRELPLPTSLPDNSFQDDDTSSLNSFCDDLQMDAEMNVGTVPSEHLCQLYFVGARKY